MKEYKTASGLLKKAMFFSGCMILLFMAGCSDSVEKVSITGTSTGATLYVDDNACTWCGICPKVCPTGAITENILVNGNYAYVIDPQKCIRCGVCIEKCPDGAIRWKR